MYPTSLSKIDDPPDHSSSNVKKLLRLCEGLQWRQKQPKAIQPNFPPPSFPKPPRMVRFLLQRVETAHQKILWSLHEGED